LRAIESLERFGIFYLEGGKNFLTIIQKGVAGFTLKGVGGMEALWNFLLKI